MQQQKFRIPVNYKDHKAIFQSISEQQRPNWIRKMLQTPQKKGEYTEYRMNYPNHGKWNYQGFQLHYYYHLNKVQPSKGILFYFPGMNAHGNGSAYFTMSMAQKCHIDIYSLDYKNFGRSAGDQRGFIESADSLIDQAQRFMEFILSGYTDKNKKIYISGLSMGGSVCFKLAIRHPQRYHGVIFLSPALKENKQVTPFMKKVGRFIGSWFPRLRLMSQTFNSATKYDQTESIMNDPYMYKDKIVPGSVRVILELMQQIQTQWDKFTSPFLLIQSGVDKLVDPFLGIDFEKVCKSQDKTVIYFKDMWHAVFAEDQMPDVVQAATQWLQPRVNK